MPRDCHCSDLGYVREPMKLLVDRMVVAVVVLLYSPAFTVCRIQLCILKDCEFF